MNTPAKKKWPDPIDQPPDDETIESWVVGDENCEATDGCTIEPDGVCPHGHPSWLIRLGIM